MMKVMHLPLMQGKIEKEEKVRKYFRVNKIMNTRRKTSQKFSVTYVINTDTMLETILYERKEGGMQPLLTLMNINLSPDLIQLKSFSSS
jgi:hypothetical protein